MENNIIITSEMRVGSRWLHYMLADMLNANVSPELDVKRLFTGGIGIVKNQIKQNSISKFHGALFWNLQAAFGEGNLKVIALVRNPRDRAVSLAFHNRYHMNHHFRQQDFDTDFEAVKWTALTDTGFKKGNMRQLGHMIPGCYITSHNGLLPYIWVDYDTFLAKNYESVYNISRILDLNISEDRIKLVTERHKFKNMAGRPAGTEVRNNLFQRKGISKDWVNWFDDEMVEKTEKEFNLYNSYLNSMHGY